MAYELRELSGSIWANDRKAQPEQPDYKGTVLVGGVTYYLSGWKRTTTGGNGCPLRSRRKTLCRGSPSRSVRLRPPWRLLGLLPRVLRPSWT